MLLKKLKQSKVLGSYGQRGRVYFKQNSSISPSEKTKQKKYLKELRELAG